MQRLRTSGSSIFRNLKVPQIRRTASNSWSAAQDTFYSTKDIFERHRVVFTISTSIASVATAWAGYSIRHLHESRVDQRLESIEKAMKNNYHIEDTDFKKLVGSKTISTPACVATAAATLIIGYALGWRGGKWYANRKFRREQMKLLGQIKPRKWSLKFLKRPLIRRKLETALQTSEAAQKDAPTCGAIRPAWQVPSEEGKCAHYVVFSHGGSRDFSYVFCFLVASAFGLVLRKLGS